jgi:hypothetical protein
MRKKKLKGKGKVKLMKIKERSGRNKIEEAGKYEILKEK